MLSEDDRSAARTRRLFFALWPDDPVRERLIDLVTDLRDRMRARWVSADHLHITLAFLGAVAEVDLPALLGLQFTRAEAFELILQSLQFRRRKQMIWIVPTLIPTALDCLVSDLARCLAPTPLRPDPRPFHAHMTLARNVRSELAAPPRFPPITWTVTSFVLVESEPDRWGVRYRVLRRWPLQALPENIVMP